MEERQFTIPNTLMHAFDIQPDEPHCNNLDSSFQEVPYYNPVQTLASPTGQKLPINLTNKGGDSSEQSNSRNNLKKVTFKQQIKLRRSVSPILSGIDIVNQPQKLENDSNILKQINEKQEDQTSITLEPQQLQLMDLKDYQQNKKPVQNKIKSKFQTHQNHENNLLGLSNKQKYYSSSLMVYYLIKRFMTTISVKRRQKLFFKTLHFSIVGDHASEKTNSLGNFKDYRSQNTLQLSGNNNCLDQLGTARFCRNMIKYSTFIRQFFFNLITKVIKPIPLIYPQSLFKIIWDLILCIVLIFFFITIPIEVFFNNGLLFINNIEITITLIIFLLCDYIIKMNTIYYEFGKAVTDRTLILSRYLKNGFLIDGISITVLLFQLISQKFNQIEIIHFTLFFFYTQFHYFSKILNETEESLNLGKFQSSILNLIKLIFTLLFIEHVFSCLWYFVADQKQKQNENNWLATRGIQNEDWTIKYLDSFYFSTVTMLSVGYGDIVPQSYYQIFTQILDPLEKIISIIFMMFACIQLSYSVNTVGAIIQSLTSQAEETKRKMKIINRYMNKKKISFGLQYQIREYLKIYWLEEISEETQESEKIMMNLSEILRNKLIFEANDTVLKQCPLFEHHFSDETKLKLLKVMKTVVINPENIVTSQLANICEPSLCFIESGELNFFFSQSSDRDLEVGIYRKGQYFGLEEFLTGNTPEIKYSSYSFVKLIVLTRSDFLRVLKESPNDYEEFCMIRDEYILQTRVNDEKCISCNCQGHDLLNCPIVHFTANKEKIIKSHQFNLDQDRNQKYLRNQKREKNQFNSLADQWAIQKELSVLLQNQTGELAEFYEQQTKVHNYVSLDNIMIKSPSKQEVDSPNSQFPQINRQNNNIPQSICIQQSPENSQIELNSNKKIKDNLQSQTQLKKLIIPKNSKRQSMLMMNRLTVTNQQNELNKITLLKKFQNAVKKIIQMNQTMPLKLLQSKQVNLKVQYQREKEKKKLFSSNMQKELQLLLSPEWEQQLKKKIKPSDFEDIYFTTRKLRLLITDHKKKGEMDELVENQFDSYKQYKTYNKNNNITRVIEEMEQAEPQHSIKDWHNQNPGNKTLEERKKILKSSLIHYLLFPNQYFKRFYFKLKQDPKKKFKDNFQKLRNVKFLYHKLKQKNQDRLKKSTSQKTSQRQIIPEDLTQSQMEM